ncbi:MAG: hypothetical protein DRP00_04515 [Candidatus Aenigmatarchaeota archaeon]|nr:MAG: hypothetical protein DRP00_04515 [Candidatus Aenigmarchaeota archaeon]
MKPEILGLNKYEWKAYKALIEIGEAKAHQISAKSNVPYGRIYDVLNSLINKGLVKLSVEKPKKYVAMDPEVVLTKIINKKLEELVKLKKEIKVLGKKYERFPEEAVFAVKGKDNFNRLIGRRKDPKKFNYAFKYVFDPHPVWRRKIKKLVEKGVDARTLGPLNEKTKENIKKWTSIEKIREFPNEGVAINIDENTVIIGLIKSDVTLVINDKAFVNLMKNLFERAWITSKEIKVNS